MTDLVSGAVRRGGSTALKFILGLAIGFGLLWLSIRHLNLHDVLAVILGADVPWLAIALILYAGNLTVRIQRWRLLLHGYENLPYRKVGTVLLSGYGINFLLPARMGELFRMELMRRRHGVARAVALSGIVIERILDGLCVVLLLGIGLWLNGQYNEPSKILRFIYVSGALVFGAAVVGWIVLRKGPLVRLFSRWPPVTKQFDLLKQSFAAVAGKRLLLVICLTGIVYANEAGALWAICRAVELNLGLLELMVLVGVSALSTLVPSAPGFVGTFQMAFVLTFAEYHQSSTLAIAAATLVQLLLFGPLIVAVIPSLLHGGISFDANLPGGGNEGPRGETHDNS
jgi:glycosyltransferase 2 family protein